MRESHHRIAIEAHVRGGGGGGAGGGGGEETRVTGFQNGTWKFCTLHWSHASESWPVHAAHDSPPCRKSSNSELRDQASVARISGGGHSGWLARLTGLQHHNIPVAAMLQRGQTA